MRLEEYRRAQDTVTGRVVAATVALLRSAAGQPVTPQSWRLLLDALFPPVVQGRRDAVELATTFYQRQHADHTNRPAPTIDPSRYDLAALDHALTRTARRRLPDPLSARAAVSDAAGAVARHVEQAGRDTVRAATRADTLALGWARVPTGRETCAWCWMLASRGPVYDSAATAGDMTSWHDRCDCQITPVFTRDGWDGRATFLTAQRLWRDSTTGRSGSDALNAFRRALSGAPGSLQPDRPA